MNAMPWRLYERGGFASWSGVVGWRGEWRVSDSAASGPGEISPGLFRLHNSPQSTRGTPSALHSGLVLAQAVDDKEFVGPQQRAVSCQLPGARQSTPSGKTGGQVGPAATTHPPLRRLGHYGFADTMFTQLKRRWACPSPVRHAMSMCVDGLVRFACCVYWCACVPMS